MKYKTTPPPPRDRREMMLGPTRLADEMLWSKLSGFLSAELDRLDDALAEDENLGHPEMLKVRDDLIAWIAMTREAEAMIIDRCVAVRALSPNAKLTHSEPEAGGGTQEK